MILAIATAFVIGTIFASTDVFAASKVTICHIPPGNPDNPQTIKIKNNALPAHLAHGDTEGACPDDGGGNGGGNGGISPETQAQIDDIQDKINDDSFGLEEIKAEIIDLLIAVGIIQDETDKIQMVKDDVGAIKTETDKIQMVKDNQYEPFTALITTTATCADVATSPDIMQVRITSPASTGNFIITGVFMSPSGLNGLADTDSIKIRALNVDGLTGGFTVSDSLVANTNGNTSFDIMGQPLRDGGTFPHQITVVNAGQVHDVLIEFTCDAGTTGSSITFNPNAIKVSGWKLASETVTVDTLFIP